MRCKTAQLLKHVGRAVTASTKMTALHSCYHPLKNFQKMLMNQQNIVQILCAPKTYESKSLFFCTFPPGLLDSRLMMAFILANQVHSLVPISIHSIMQK